MTKKRIILTGAQCTGKTTLAKELAKDGTTTLSVARDLANELGWPPADDKVEDYQKTLFSKMTKELSSKKSYISDRGFTDVVAHTFAEALDGKISEKTANNQYLEMQKFHNDNPDILVAYIPIEFEMQDDGLRNTDNENQRKIDYLIKQLLDTAGIKYITVSGTLPERISQIEYELNN